MAFFRRPAPTPDPIDSQQQAIRELALFLHGIASDEAWERREMTVKPLLSGVEFRIEEHTGGRVGTAAGILPDAQTLQVIQLLKAMCTDKGTWLSMLLTVTSAGSADVRFNYTDEPGAVAGPPGMPAAEVHAHLEAFPRPTETIPDWMRDRLAGQEPPAE